MFRLLSRPEAGAAGSAPGEGDLFKVISLSGKSFELRYGFYEECDRYSHNAEPVPIYPDFLAEPEYADDGSPFVTAMQLPCEHFAGRRHEDSGCGDCAFYRHGEELLGICARRPDGKGEASIFICKPEMGMEENT